MVVESGEASRRLRERMAELTHTEAKDWFLTAKARQAMQVAFKAVKETTGRPDVATQLFTCITAIDPIIVAGLTPRYVDVDPQTLSLDSALLEVGERTSAVVLQHTFGIVDEASSGSLQEAAHACGALLVEDCAHCVGRMARGADGEPLADVSVHSFGVEKILPGTYFGGVVWLNPSMAHQELAQSLRRAFTELPAMPKRLERASRSYLNQVRILTRLPQGASQALRARWERRGTFEPAVSLAERRGASNHEPCLPSDWVCNQALAALKGLDANEQNRRACAQTYASALEVDAPEGLFVPEAAFGASDQPLLRFPVFAHDEHRAKKVAHAVEALGYYMPDWPRPLLVPGALDLAPYGLAGGTGGWPVSERLAAGVASLPTDVDPGRIPAIVQAVRDALRE